MGAKTSLNLASFHNSEFCDNYTFDIESSNHIVIPPIQEGDQPPPPEPIQEGDADYDMPPPEPIQDDDDDMPPLEPIQDGDADYDDMPPLEPIQDDYADYDMPPLEPIQDDYADYDMPPPESIHRFLQLFNNNNSGLRYDTTEPTSSPIVFTNDTVVNTVIQSFISRSNLGFKKYNNTLDRDDLSTLDWVNHTQEELMDAILYLERLKKNL